MNIQLNKQLIKLSNKMKKSSLKQSKKRKMNLWKFQNLLRLRLSKIKMQFLSYLVKKLKFKKRN